MANDDRQSDLSILEAGAQNTTSKPRRALADVTILGMRLCRRGKTDAEYVASVRKAVMHSKWMAVGLLFGALTGYLFVQGGSSFIQMLTIKQGQRTERLMLKFHDALQSREQSAAPTDSVD